MCDNVSDNGKMDDWTYLGFPLVHRIRCSRTTLELGRNISEKEKPKTSFFTLRKYLNRRKASLVKDLLNDNTFVKTRKTFSFYNPIKFHIE